MQYRLGQAFTEVRKFASLADTRGELKADIGLEATGLESRAAVAGVVSAWEGARKYCEKADELKAEARILGVSRPVTQTDRAAMKASFEAVPGSLRRSTSHQRTIWRKRSRRWNPPKFRRAEPSLGCHLPEDRQGDGPANLS